MSSQQPEPLGLHRLATPIGEALVATDAAGSLCAVDWSDYEARLRRLMARHHPGAVLIEAPAPAKVAAAFQAYFAGELLALEPLAWRTNGTSFQTAVWSALREIPPGSTISYAELARRIGAPRAVRAVGLANGANPVGVAVPCHRVIGARGVLTGYAGGLERKRWLLAHEGVALAA